MEEIRGEYSTAIVFSDNIEPYASAQIQQLCDNPVTNGCRIRVMPDVHPGKIGVIGLTMTVKDKIIPNIVGLDIGCGITCAKIKNKTLEYQKLDAVIKKRVPTGANIRKEPHRFMTDCDISKLRCFKAINEDKSYMSLGTLGSGNHFIEIDKDEEDNLYVVIHSGSRHLGVEVAEYYQNTAHRKLKKAGLDIANPLAYVEGEMLDDYIHDMEIVQEFAELNRDCILDELEKGMKLKVTDCFSTVHNYIDTSRPTKMLRKGAISARKNETLAIPINMRDGVLICRGKGNSGWNYSAPHGSGRIFKRIDVKSQFSLTDYKKSMKGIYSSCITEGTLDEAPFAYRSLEDIINYLSKTVEVKKILKPVYNFKDVKKDNNKKDGKKR